MKRILLASASIVAFAGAASAEVGFGGSATLGYNDDIEDGFFWDGELAITLEQDLDNGLVAAATVTADLVDNEIDGVPLEADGFVLSLSSDTAALFFGDTATAAGAEDANGASVWDAVPEMATDNFIEEASDLTFDDDGDATTDEVEVDDAVLRGDFAMGGVFTSVSGLIGNEPGSREGIRNYQLAMAGTFGAFGVMAAYQEEGGSANELAGITLGTAFAGADVDVSFVRDMTLEENSTGIELGYQVGPVGLSGFYTMNDDAGTGDVYGVEVAYSSGAITVTVAYQDGEVAGDEYAVDAAYDFGMGLEAFAGFTDVDDAYYVGATYEVAEGSTLFATFAEGDDETDDEIGDPEVRHGTTVGIDFTF